MNLKHPWDWVAHLFLILAVTLIFGPEIAASVGITIELTQLEAGIFQGWDHAIDLVADAIGLLFGYLWLRSRRKQP